MSHLHTVEAFSLTAIKDAQLESPAAHQPLSQAAIDLLLQECPVVVALRKEGPDTLPLTGPREVVGYSSDSVKLSQPTAYHQRSFQLHSPGLEAGLVDKYGNRYGAVTLKGNNFTEPRAIKHPTAVNEVVAYGLQESKIIERVLRASDVLRARNIATEWIIGLAEPRQYPYPLVDATTAAYTLLNRTAYTKRIAENYWQTLPETEHTIERLSDIMRQFQDMTFYITMRAMDSAYRLGDIRERVDNFDQFLVEEALTDTAEDDGAPRTLDEQSSLIAANLGVNLARLHVDLKHGFLHSFNITAKGGIVDLDSVSGEALGLGDEPITAADRAYDVQTAIFSLLNRDADSIEALQSLTRYNHATRFVNLYYAETVQLHGADGAAEILADICLDPGLHRAVHVMLLDAYMTYFIDYLEHDGVRVYDVVAEETDRQFFAWLDSDDAFEVLASHLKDNILELVMQERNKEPQPRSKMTEQLVRDTAIEQFWNKSWHMPDTMMALDSATRRILQAYLHTAELQNCFGERWSTIQGKYAPTIDEAIAHYQLEQPTPTIKGLSPEAFWTYQNQLTTVVNLCVEIPYANIASQVDALPEAPSEVTAPTLTAISLANASTITEIITDGAFGMSLQNQETNSIEFEFESTEDGAPTYLIVVRQENGAKQVTIHRAAAASPAATTTAYQTMLF